MPRNPLSLIHLSPSNAHDTRWRACRAMLTMLDSEHVEQRSRCSMASMLSNAHDAWWQVCQATFDHLYKYTRCAYLGASYSIISIARLSDLRILSNYRPLLLILTPYLLSCNKHPTRSVTLKRRLSIWVSDILATLSTQSV